MKKDLVRMQSFKQFLTEAAPGWISVHAKMTFSSTIKRERIIDVVDELSDLDFPHNFKLHDVNDFEASGSTGNPFYIRVLFDCPAHVTMDDIDDIHKILNDVGTQISGDKIGVDNDLTLCLRKLPENQTFEYYSVKLYCSSEELNSLISIHKKITFANQIVLGQPQFIEAGGLGLMLIQNISFLTITGNQTPWAKIIQNAIRSHDDLLDAKALLIEQGYSQNAKL
ncbi:MAG: hypothetical protein QXN55_01735 [Candidatus Nitrosotenuis sp.]